MYRIRYYCTNCDHDFLKEIPKGTPAPPQAVCPNCGCNTAYKDSWIGGTSIRRMLHSEKPYPKVPDQDWKWPTYGWENYQRY